MTQPKHTPGPWSPGYKNINVVAVNAKIGGETPVCDIRGWGYLTGNGHGALGLPADEAVAIQEANARIIAASPDMLEALRQVVAENAPKYHDCTDDGLDACAWCAARAAIAKAEGAA